MTAAPRSVKELNIITGSLELRFRIRVIVSSPSIPGISRSSVMRSGLSCGMSDNARLPLDAVPAISISGSERSNSLSTARMTTESSTINTRIGVIPISIHFQLSARKNLTISSHPPMAQYFLHRRMSVMS